MAKEEKNPYVEIGVPIAGIMVPIVLFVVLFVPEQAWILAPIIASMSIMAIALGYFSSKKK